MGGKTAYRFDLYEDQKAWLGEMTTAYNLADPGKALRVVLEYAIKEGDKDRMFKRIRCRHCAERTPKEA